MKKLHIFTSAACNYIPKVRMLFQSLRQLHPEAVLHLALADERTPLLDLELEPFDDVMTVAELGIPDWHPWAFCHSIVELATAIKPFFLKHLLEREDCAQVLYLDPDMVAFSRLDDILDALARASIVLTPHQIDPESTMGAIMDNEISSLKHGVYNLGFVGVANTAEGRRFAAWWASRIYHFCRNEIHNGLFTDQRWIDLVPAFFDDVAIVRSSRHNVATWNLTTRQLTRAVDGAYLVDDEPLGFYHFTGFDSGAHRIMACRNAPGNVAVQSLVDWYDDSTKNLAQDPLAKVQWAYGVYSNGKLVPRSHRFIYRERVDLQRAYPNPFDTERDGGYYGWVTHQGPKEFAALFDKRTVDNAMVELSRNLTPGFRPHLEGENNGSGIGDLLGQAMRNPSFGLSLAKRAITIVRREGWRGIAPHLKR